MLGKSPAPNMGTAPFCAITGRGVDEDGWFTNQQVLTGHDPVAWISHAGARLLAQSIGYHSPTELAAVLDDLASTRAQLDQAVEMISELRKQVAGIEGLSAAGFEVSKKTGRPPKNTEKPEIVKELSSRG